MTIPSAPATHLAPAAGPLVEGACEMCPHTLHAHDSISLRFCTATRAAALTRGCVCPSS